MRRIIISEGQDAMLRVASMTIFSIMHNKVTDGEIYVPLDDMSISDRLLANSIVDSENNFNDDIASVPSEKVANAISKLISVCVKKERNIKEELVDICHKTIDGLFNLQEEAVKLDLELVDMIDQTHTFHIKKGDGEERQYGSYSEIEDEKEEIEKRHLLNYLIQGMCEYVTNIVLKKSLSSVFDLDEELPHMYSKLLKLNDYAVTTIDDEPKDNDHHQGGYVDVYVGDTNDVSKITVKAIIYPILVFETVKGIMEAVISQYLPQDRNTAISVLDSTDTLVQSNWNYRIGKSIWSKIRNVTDIADNEILPFVSVVASKSAEEVKDLFREVLHGTRRGDEMLNDIVDVISYSNRYQGFLDDLEGKKKRLITDDDDYGFLIN